MSTHEVWVDLFGEKHIQCNCHLCVQHRAVEETIARRDTDDLISTITDIMDENCNIGSDLDYYKCIMDGSWPSSVEILEIALGKAKLKQVKS